MNLAIHSQRASYYYGGTERYVLNMALELQKLGEKISLVTYNAPIKSEWFLKFKKNFKGNIIFLKSKELDKNFKIFKKATEPEQWDKESILFSRLSKKIYERNDFDLIIFHYATDCLGAPKNRKICLHLHGLPSRTRKIECRAIRIPSKIIAVSNYVRRGWKKLYRIGKKIYIVYNGIDLNISINKSYEKKNDLLFFGRLIKTKGVDILLNAINKLKFNLCFRNIKVKVVGEGPEKGKLINLSEKLGLKKNIKILGHMKDSDLKKIIMQSKICIFPSYSKEGVMTTLLESSLLKSCILASKACSNSEFIKNNFNGILFKSKNHEDLAKKIKKLLLNENLRKNFGENAYEHVKKWSWEIQAKKLIRIYKK
jgi:glycosyltransferase involved in cell wall biosynthesis